MAVYRNKSFSLEEKALTQVAINLCQSTSFKEVALNLEKPTYGCFLREVPFPSPAYFESDPEILSAWAKVKDDNQLCETFQEPSDSEDAKYWSRWHAAVDEQCLRLTEGMPLPNSLKQGLRPWIKRIALEYLAFYRRQEMLFDVTCYFLMDILTVEVWKLDGRIDEEKVALRLLKDQRLTALKKFPIACVYCLQVHIEQLWDRLTHKEKQFFLRGGFKLFRDCRTSIRLWSRFMNGDIREQKLWTKMADEAIRCGNRSALMVCWKRLQEPMRQQMLINSALFSRYQWEKLENYDRMEAELVSPLVPGGLRFVEDYTLPSYYSEMTVFFLSQMDEEQILAFFKEAFQSSSSLESISITKFLLDWPHQDCFLPTIKQLWGIIPKDEYKRCLMVLTQKYCRIDGKANCDYDYRSLLGALWEETPEEYKNFVFRKKREQFIMIDETLTLPCQLLRKSPFQEKDQMLFKQIFRDLPQEKRREMMLGDSDVGGFICSQLIQNEEWTFLNWLLKECMAEKEIACFKKRIIPSFYGLRLCMKLFEEDHEKLLEDAFNWCFASNAEKVKCKHKFLKSDDCLFDCALLLRKGKFSAVERVINFCSSSDKDKKRFQLRCSLKTCGDLLANYANSSRLEDGVWEQLDKIIAWSVDTEKKRRKFKKDLILHCGIDTHYNLVFVQRRQEKIERFYQWFDLTPEEIKQLKWDTLVSTKALVGIEERLLSGNGLLLPLLRYCLTDEEMVINFKNEVKYFWQASTVELLEKILENIQKEVQDEINEIGVFVKDKRRKRSAAVEDESNSLKKQHK